MGGAVVVVVGFEELTQPLMPSPNTNNTLNNETNPFLFFICPSKDLNISFELQLKSTPLRLEDQYLAIGRYPREHYLRLLRYQYVRMCDVILVTLPKYYD